MASTSADIGAPVRIRRCICRGDGCTEGATRSRCSISRDMSRARPSPASPRRFSISSSTEGLDTQANRLTRSALVPVAPRAPTRGAIANRRTSSQSHFARWSPSQRSEPSLRSPIVRTSRQTHNSHSIPIVNRFQGVLVMRTRLLVFGTALSFLAAGSAAAQQRQGPPGQRPGAQRPAAERDSGAADSSAGVAPVERVSTTQHTITIDGKPVSYTAHAGTMVLRDSTGKPDASVFYISYTKDGVDAANRPVTFFFNGGPGSASIWLDEGIMSPKHPEMGPAGSEPAPPYNLVDNRNSPLDVTDLVQVDAMMTGYSRPAPGVKASEFTGAVNDVAMFGQFIRDYLDKYDRWASPKYLFGESYGTFRSAGLASELQEREGIELNGIMLLGTVLDFQYISQDPTNDIAYSTFLPTYTATAWYHKKLPSALQSESLEQVVAESRQYAFGDYMTALAKGNDLSQSERQAVAQKLSQLTGISEQYLMNT